MSRTPAATLARLESSLTAQQRDRTGNLRAIYAPTLEGLETACILVNVAILAIIVRLIHHTERA